MHSAKEKLGEFSCQASTEAVRAGAGVSCVSSVLISLSARGGERRARRGGGLVGGAAVRGVGVPGYYGSVE